LSSILDALKKAEQESTPDRGVDSPWSPLPAQPDRQGFRWWVPLGIVVVVGVSGLVAWQALSPEATRSALPVSPAPPSSKSGDASAPAVATAQQARPATPVPVPAASPPPSAKKVPPSTVARITPPAASPPARPVNQPPPATVSTPEPMVATSSPPAQTQRQATAPPPVPVAAPAAPQPRPTMSAAATGPPPAAPADTEKTFRTDPRIDLQALVWAPEAAARFVVINNRLVKEGGSVDNIAVLKINPDDVLLAEGTDRWHVEFNVR
jgi:outer membrane biosynthesis protein TonB